MYTVLNMILMNMNTHVCWFSFLDKPQCINYTVTIVTTT